MLLLLNKTTNLMEGLSFLWVVYSGFELELWHKLSKEQTLEDLIKLNPNWDRVLLDHWLEQAYCLDLVSKHGRTYRLTRLGKSLLTYRDLGLEAMFREFVLHWSPNFAGLPGLLGKEKQKTPLGTEMEEQLISRASLASEPFVWPYLKAKCQKEKWRRVLDIGCGEGIYLQKLLTAFDSVSGVGIELNSVVAARANQSGGSFGDRLKIICADALNLNEDIGLFDVCLLNNNIYYFSAAQRACLLARLKDYLSSHGQIGILTALRATDYQARIFKTYIPQNLMSFFLACHQGFNGLPTETEVKELLKANGFINISANPLAMRTSFYFWAQKP